MDRTWFPLATFAAVAAALSPDRPLLGVGTAVATATASYWLHRSTHVGVLSALPLGHARVHHDAGHWLHTLPAGGWLAAAHELCTNVMCSGGFVLLCPGLPRVLPGRVVLWTALLYTSLHFVNFHDAGPAGALHRAHHADPTTNFGPSVLDAAFGTGTGHEDMLDWVPNMLAASAAVACVTG